MNFPKRKPSYPKGTLSWLEFKLKNIIIIIIIIMIIIIIYISKSIIKDKYYGEKILNFEF